MAIAVTDAWRAGVQRKDARIRYLAIIDDNVNGPWKSLSGSHDSLTYHVGLASPPSSVAGEISPIERSVTIGQIVADFHDKYLRPILINNRLKGQSLVVKMGSAEIPENDFCFYGSGIIQSTLGDGKSGIITVTTLDPFTVLDNTDITGAWVGVHPLEILYDGAGNGVLELAGVPTSLIDTNSFDPANYTGSISHWNTLRGGFADVHGNIAISTPMSAYEVIKQLSFILNGVLIITEEGKFQFARYDGTAAVAASWTSKEIRSCKPIEHGADIVNRFILKFWRFDNDFQAFWKNEDTDSITAHQYLGGGVGGAYAKDNTTPWLNAYSYGFNVANDPQFLIGDLALTLTGGGVAGMTGCRGALDGPQPADAEISGARPAYLMIRGRQAERQQEPEIVKATACTPNTDNEMRVSWNNPDTGVYEDIGWFCDTATYTVTRAQLGTVEQDWTSPIVLDITQAIDITSQIVKRFGNGVDVIEVITGMGEFDKSLADLVNVTDNDFVGFGNDGLDGTDKYEIILKEPRPEDGEITWRVVGAAPGSPAESYQASISGKLTAFDEQTEAAGNQDVFRVHVLSGLESTTVGAPSLNGALSAGIVSNPGHAGRTETTAQTYTYTANKDTYIYYDFLVRTLIFRAVANLAAEPGTFISEITLWKVVTGATITSHTDRRETLAIDSFDKVADGSTYLKVVGVSGANQVQSSSLANDCVIAGKINNGGVSGPLEIAQNVVGVHQSIGADVRSSINRNSHFLQYTRG